MDYFALNSIYGELMAETSILDARETGLVEFVACLADGVVAQAKGHFFGARNLGASGAEVRGAIRVVEVVTEAVGLWRDDSQSEAWAFLGKAEGW